MNYKNIVLFHFISFAEAFIIKLFINNNIIICNFLKLIDIYSILSLIAVKNILFLGGYQIYFWSQKKIFFKKKKVLKLTVVDKYIPALPGMYWIYSPIYYMIFNLVFFFLQNYLISVLNVWIMIINVSFFFILLPTSIPFNFRKKIINIKTDFFTKIVVNLVHSNDLESNVFPSLHCAFSIYLSFIIYEFYDYFSIIFPFLIAFACCCCKQHLIVDIIPGFALGIFYSLINIIMN